jgi:SAM-dependent methyltransferase
MSPLDIRDISIIDAIPLLDTNKEVLNVGCGEGRIDYHLSKLGYTVHATDYNKHDAWEDIEGVNFQQANIFDKDTFPVCSSDIVLCSEVLEHLENYKDALNNLIELTNVRLIITFPFEKSYNDKQPPPIGHCNWWNDKGTSGFKDVREFYKLCYPYSVSISKIRTKPRDVQMGQWDYLVVVDKKQKYG